MIDIHSHLLPGVDDGSANIETSVAVLQRFERQGIEVLVCTPHLEASRAERAPFERHRELLAELIAAAPPKPQLRLGWEIMLDRPGCDLRSPTLSLGGARAVLVGRAYAYGLAAAGEPGVARAIEILRTGIVRTMKLLGVSSVHDLNPSYVNIPAGWLPRERPDSSL